MVYIQYENTFEGFLTAIFEIYDRKISIVHLVKIGQAIPDLFAESLSVNAESDKSLRVANKIEALSGKQGVSLLWKCFLSEIPGIEDTMLSAIQYLLRTGKNVFGDFGHPAILELKQTEKKMSRERHRMTAFVRFQLGKDNLYYALIEPDFDVLPLLTSHFKGRYADQRWLIYDLKRKYGIYYDLNEVAFVSPQDESNDSSANSTVLDLQEEEILYQSLWKDYFKSTNIKERKNMKLHLQHVPKRYWKYLIEKQ